MKLAELVALAIKEDLPQGDVTTDGLNLSLKSGRALLQAKEDLVLSGVEPFEETFRQINTDIKVKWHCEPGKFVWKDQTVAVITGPYSSLLKGERVALNFLGRLCGVATLTSCFARQLEGTKCKILDTRKTTPLWRELEKSAVVHGGGLNHRMSLSDSVLIKDNHIAAVGSLAAAVELVRTSGQNKISVECATLDDVKEAVRLNVQRILLDNMTDENLALAVKMIPAGIETEASGNMTIERVGRVARLGIQFISVGAITHSAPCADLSLRFSEL